MFTGLVQAIGTVKDFSRSPSGASIVIDPGTWTHLAAHGESISVSGVCLTHTGNGADRLLRFDAVPETLAKTTLGSLKAGDPVNLEHALRADTLLGGHFVQGHVDGIGRILHVQSDPADWRVTLSCPPGHSDAVVPKGSICLDGVSLTIAAVGPGHEFQVALIPTTLELTTLKHWRSGISVNVETDMIAKTVVHWLAMRQNSDRRAGT